MDSQVIVKRAQFRVNIFPQLDKLSSSTIFNHDNEVTSMVAIDSFYPVSGVKHFRKMISNERRYIMLVLKRIPIGIFLCSCFFVMPAGAQDDPYAAVERPLQALDSLEATAHVAACDSTCFSLVWAPRAPVPGQEVAGELPVDLRIQERAP